MLFVSRSTFPPPSPLHLCSSSSLSLSRSLWTPSPSPFVSGLSSVIDAAIYIPWDPRRKWRERCVCMFVWIVEGWWPLTSGPHLQTDRQTDLQLWGLCVRYLWFSLRTASNLSLYLEQAGNWTLSRDLFARCCLERQEWSVKLNFGSVFLEVNI